MTKNSCQKKTNFSEISGAKVVQFRCYIKSTETKNVPLNWYSSTKLFFRKIQMIFDVEIDFENQILVLFDSYFWTFYKSHEKIKFIFVISAIIPSIWNVFIKFCWHDENLTAAAGTREPFSLVYSLVSVNYPCAIFKGVSHHTCRQNNVIHNEV